MTYLLNSHGRWRTRAHSRNNPRTYDENIHVRPQEAIEGLFRVAHYRFIFIKRGIEQHRYTGDPIEFADQLMIKWVIFLANGLKAT